MQIKSKPFSQARMTPMPQAKELIERKPQHLKRERKLNPAACSTFALAIWHPIRVLSTEQAEVLGRCHELKVSKQRMKEDLSTQVAELAKYVSRMKRAPEEAKIALMNAFVTHMAEKQIAMNARQAALQEEMMTHMILHMQVDKDSISNCAAICKSR